MELEIYTSIINSSNLAYSVLEFNEESPDFRSFYFIESNNNFNNLINESRRSLSSNTLDDVLDGETLQNVNSIFRKLLDQPTIKIHESVDLNGNLTQSSFYRISNKYIWTINPKSEESTSNSNLEEQIKFLQEQNKQLANETKEILESQDKLEAANNAKDRFFSIISHDLKNPINSFIHSTQVLRDYYDEGKVEATQKHIKYMQKQSKSLKLLLDQILTWSRSQLGKIEFEPGLFDLGEIAKETITTLSSLARDKSIKIGTNIDTEYMAQVDRNMIITVLRNLIGNAIKFTNENGNIKIQFTDLGAEIEIKIIDDGVGISTEDMDKLFRIDVQHSSFGTNKEKGTGLGLLLCNEFVSKHNGTISVDSTLGEGTSFTIKIPKF